MGLYADTRVTVFAVSYTLDSIIHGEAKVNAYAQNLLSIPAAPVPPDTTPEEKVGLRLFGEPDFGKDFDIHLNPVALPYSIENGVLSFTDKRLHIYQCQWKQYHPSKMDEQLLLTHIERELMQRVQTLQQMDIQVPNVQPGRIPYLLYAYSSDMRKKYPKGTPLYRARLAFTLKPQEWGQKARKATQLTHTR